VELAPITLVYGENGVGKSTLLKSVLALSQNIISNRSIADEGEFFFSSGHLIDLGPIRSLKRRGADRSKKKSDPAGLFPDSEFSVGVGAGSILAVQDFQVEDRQEFPNRPRAVCRSLRMQSSSGEPILSWTKIPGAGPFGFKQKVRVNSESIDNESLERRLDLIEELRKLFSGFIDSFCGGQLPSFDLSQSDPGDVAKMALSREVLVFKAAAEIKEIMRLLIEGSDAAAGLWNLVDLLTDERLVRPVFFSSGTNSDILGSNCESNLWEALALLLPDDYDLGTDLEEFGVSGFGGDWFRLSIVAQNQGLGCELAFEPDVYAKVSRNVATRIGNTSYIKSGRSLPASTDLFPVDEVPSGGLENLAFPYSLYKNEELIKDVNWWLSEFGSRMSIDTERGGGDYFWVRATQRIDDELFTLPLDEIGSGLGQLIPMICELMSSKGDGGTIVIEEPETNLHQVLQTKLADLFAAVSLSNQQLLIETHSEVLVHSLLRKVKQGEISSDWLSIISVSSDGKTSSARNLKINKYGEFVGGWPEDFFPLDYMD